MAELAERLHIWSDIPGHFSLSLGPGAHDHAEEDGGISINVKSLRDLENKLGDLAYKGHKFSYVDFHCHGSAGSIAVGHDSINVDTVYDFQGRGYSQLFKENAEIRFVGCSVGSKAKGEYFLTQFASVFLRRNGGWVGGNSAVGFNIASEPVHPFGRYVWAYAAGGQVVAMQGHTWLRAKSVKERANFAEWTLQGMGSMLKQEHLDYVIPRLRVARKNAAECGGINGYDLLYIACTHLDEAEDYLEKVTIRQATPPVPA